MLQPPSGQFQALSRAIVANWVSTVLEPVQFIADRARRFLNLYGVPQKTVLSCSCASMRRMFHFSTNLDPGASNRRVPRRAWKQDGAGEEESWSSVV